MKGLGVNHLCSCKLAASGGAVLALAGKQPQLNSRQTSKNIYYKFITQIQNTKILQKYKKYQIINTKTQIHKQVQWYRRSEETSTQQGHSCKIDCMRLLGTFENQKLPISFNMLFCLIFRKKLLMLDADAWLVVHHHHYKSSLMS